MIMLHNKNDEIIPVLFLVNDIFVIIIKVDAGTCVIPR